MVSSAVRKTIDQRCAWPHLRKPSWQRVLIPLIVIGLWIPRTVANEAGPAVDFFESKVRPIFVEHCAPCHGQTNPEAGLRLDSAAAVSRGSDAGIVIVPGKPDESRLLQALGYSGSIQMPPEGKLDEAKIAFVREWIAQGAVWPEYSLPQDETRKESATEWTDEKGHWAFQPVIRQPLPDVRAWGWCQNPVDRFILAQLEAKGMQPNKPVDRRTFLRRVTYDLIGLPPTPTEIEAFEQDARHDAKERVVDRLLASPHYGERWGRHWLDVARYADTRGYVGVDEGDIERREYPFAYSYRDWVVRAFNMDLPYDQFLQLQIAADRLLSDPSSPDLAALGYFRVGRVFLQNRHDQIDDRIDVLMRGMQGLTVSCARCHDHKFDPIPTADYYALYGVFQSTQEPDDVENQRMLLRDAEQAVNARVLVRGNPATPGDEVPRRFLRVLSGDQRRPFRDGSGRLELARAIASQHNPLTARVWVNRVWGHHCGTPLVTTPSDFGLRTQRPQHHELLDWLAAELMSNGWSTKRLHRLVVLSETYSQSSSGNEEYAKIDPQNRLYWKIARRRLDFEQLRDSLLVASGDINLSLYGVSEEISVPPYSKRRSVYARVDRQNLPSVFRTFDFANPDGHNAGRFQTVVPQQGLYMLNDPFVLDCARKTVQTLMREEVGPASIEAGICQIYRQVLQRFPSTTELQLAKGFLEGKTTAAEMVAAPDSAMNPWEQLVQALMMTNEFTFVD